LIIPPAVIPVEVPLPQIFSIFTAVILDQDQFNFVSKTRFVRTALIEDQEAVSFVFVAQVSFTIATTLSQLSRSVETVTQL
jgi:hypothetical protein